MKEKKLEAGMTSLIRRRGPLLLTAILLAAEALLAAAIILYASCIYICINVIIFCSLG